MAMEIQDIPMAVISMAVAIIVVTVMSLIIVGVQDQAADQTGTTINETLTWAGNNTAMSLVEPRIQSLTLYNNGTIVNNNTFVIVSLNPSSVTIVNTSLSGSLSELITSDLNASYTYFFGSAAYNSTGEGLTANTTFSSFFPLIALVLIGAVIIGIVVRYFRKPE